MARESRQNRRRPPLPEKRRSSYGKKLFMRCTFSILLLFAVLYARTAYPPAADWVKTQLYGSMDFAAMGFPDFHLP